MDAVYARASSAGRAATACVGVDSVATGIRKGVVSYAVVSYTRESPYSMVSAASLSDERGRRPGWPGLYSGAERGLATLAFLRSISLHKNKVGSRSSKPGPSHGIRPCRCRDPSCISGTWKHILAGFPSGDHTCCKSSCVPTRLEFRFWGVIRKYRQTSVANRRGG